MVKDAEPVTKVAEHGVRTYGVDRGGAVLQKRGCQVFYQCRVVRCTSAERAVFVLFSVSVYLRHLFRMTRFECDIQNFMIRRF